VSGVAAIASGLFPMRALGFVPLPAILFVGACLQARGYAYQFVPVTAAVHVLLLLALSTLWEHGGDGDWSSNGALAGTLALSFVAYHSFENIEASPFRWDGDKTKWDVPSQHFAEDEKQVGLYVKNHTKPNDRVFAYSSGENASVVLLYAERRTASPFFHSFWLDPIDLLPQSEIKPGPKELAALTDLQKEIQAVACKAVEQNKPAAMTLNLLEQTFKVCPNISDMLRNDYDDAATIGSFHVYLRRPSGAGV
jgi:hypothetical protein